MQHIADEFRIPIVMFLDHPRSLTSKSVPRNFHGVMPEPLTVIGMRGHARACIISPNDMEKYLKQANLSEWVNCETSEEPELPPDSVIVPEDD